MTDSPVQKIGLAASITILALSVLLALGAGIFIGQQAKEDRIVAISHGEEQSYTTIPLPNGNIVKVPKGQRVTVKYNDTTEEAGGSREQKADGHSQGGYAKRITGVNESVFGAPELKIDGLEGSGGAFNSSTEFAAGGGANILIIAGILFVAGAVAVLVFIKDWKLAFWIGLAGGSLIGVGLLVQTYPWVLLIGAAVGLGVLIWFVWANWENWKTKFALKKIVQGVERADPDAQAKVKASIGEQTGSRKEAALVKSTVTKIKEKEIEPTHVIHVNGNGPSDGAVVTSTVANTQEP